MCVQKQVKYLHYTSILRYTFKFSDFHFCGYSDLSFAMNGIQSSFFLTVNYQWKYACMISMSEFWYPRLKHWVCMENMSSQYVWLVSVENSLVHLFNCLVKKCSPHSNHSTEFMNMLGEVNVQYFLNVILCFI